MILILLLGPFAQQSVSVGPREVVDLTRNASVPVVVDYDEISNQWADPDPSMGNKSFQPPTTPTQIQITRGLVDSDGADYNEVPSSCSTANCTFDPYVSLGICSTLEDYTSHITLNCTQNQNCTHTVDELAITPNQHHDFGQSSLLWITPRRLNSTFDDENSKIILGEEVSGANKYAAGSLVEFYIYFYSKDKFQTPDANRTDPRAFKGSLRFCLHEYQTVFQAGLTKTTLLRTYDHLQWRRRTVHLEGLKAWVEVPNSSNHTQYEIRIPARNALEDYLRWKVFTGNLENWSQRENTTNGAAVVAFTKAIFHLDETWPRWQGEKSFKQAERVLQNVAVRMTNG